jgi:hypothetical protein
MKSRFLPPASLLLLATAAPLAAQTYRVGTPFEPRVSAGRVEAMVTTPDGLWTVYAGDQRLAGVRDLFAVPSDGSAPPRRLSRPMVYLGDVQIGDEDDEPLGLHVTADGSRVVYRADVEVDERFELWSVRLAGSGVPNPVRLNPELDPGEVVHDHVLLVPGASGGCGWVVFAVGTPSYMREMWVAPADGSVPAWRLDAGTGLDIQDFSVSADGSRVLYVYHGLGMIAALDGSGVPLEVAPGAVEARLSPDGTRVVYRDFQSALHRLYSVPSSGGTPVLLANDSFDFQIAPDSGHVVYSWGGATVPRISCVPIAGGTARALSETDGGSLVHAYAITAAGRVVFSGIQPVHGRGLYAVDIASGSPQPLSAPIVFPEALSDFRLNAQGTVALYRAGVFAARDLHAVRIDGTAAPIALAVDVEDDYRFTPDGFSACYRSGEIAALYRRPLGGGPAVRLDLVDPQRPTLSFALDPSGERVLFRRNAGAPQTAPVELHSVRADGSDSLRLDDGRVSVSLANVARFEPAGTGARCVFLADAEQDDVYELWSASTRRGSTSVRLNVPMPPAGDVQADFVVTGDGARVAYRADQDVDERFGLWVSPVSGAMPAVELTAGFATGDVAAGLLVDATGELVVFRADFARPGTDDLYVAPLDGSGPPVRVNDDTDHGVGAPLRLAGGWILYLGRRATGQQHDLYRVPLDGSAPPVRLSVPATHGGISAVEEALLVTPDGTRVMFRASMGLFGAPVDGSSAPVRLNHTFGANEFLFGYELAADGSRLLYETQVGTVSGFRLYSVPLDRSSEPVLLVSTVTWPTSFVSSGSSVVLRRDDCLAVVPADGSAPLLELTPHLPDIRTELVVAPDGATVVFARGYPFPGIQRLERVPLDGARPPETMVGPLPSGQRILEDFRITPDGRRLVYKHSFGANYGLYSLGMAGKGSGALIGGEVHLQDNPLAFEITSDSRLVLFQRGSSLQTNELFATSVDLQRTLPSTAPR